jgi:hypothetical protein
VLPGSIVMAERWSKFRPNLDFFGVPRLNPGWLYVFKDGIRFKVGKTTNPKGRLFAARTWVPNIEVIGIKPFWNISSLERQMLSGLVQFWVADEWYECSDDSCDLLFEDFSNFYDEDRDMNSVDFIYWINGSGMAELLIEHNRRRISLKR